MIPTAVKTNHCFGQSCSSAKANTSYFLKLKLCHWVMNHLHGEQRGGCWNFWSANMIGCLCLSAQWASTTEWRWQKRPLITNCPLLPAAKKKRLLIAGLPHGFLLQTQTMFSTTEKNTQVNFFANLEFRLKKGQAGWRWNARQNSLWHRSQNVAFSLNFFLKFKKETYYFFSPEAGAGLVGIACQAALLVTHRSPAFLSPASTATEASRMYYLG